jgi:putative ABC transport system permease protein
MTLILRSILSRTAKKPLRGLLTISSIGIGVAIVTLVFNISFRLNEYVNRIFAQNGHKIVIANAEMRENNQIDWATPVQFSIKDAEILKNSLDEIQYVSPVNAFLPENRILVGNHFYKTRAFMGVGKDYAAVYNLKLIAGSFFTGKDIVGRHPVAVISEPAAKILFGSAWNAIGRIFFDIRRRTQSGERIPFEIIGVYSRISRLESEAFGIADFLIPYTIYGLEDSLIRVMAVKTTTKSIQATRARVKKIIDDIHGHNIKVAVWEGNPGDPNCPFFRDQRALFTLVSIFLNSLGMIILLVSSFGIFSMMMISILERTREIGLRRALGSTRAKIVGHFIIETCVLSFMGSLSGIILAFIFNAPVMNAIKPLLAGPGLFGDVNLSSLPAFKAVLYAFILSESIGIIFGLYPAISAARISPVESLTEE